MRLNNRSERNSARWIDSVENWEEHIGVIGNGAAASSVAAILVVEDDVILRMGAAGMLEDAGYRVLEASCASEALEILRAHCGILAVMTDIEMPGSIDGVALAHRIDTDWPDIGVIITSGRFQPGPDELPERAIFIGKPYSRADIVGCIHILKLPQD